MIQRILMQTTLFASLTFVTMGSAYAQDSAETEGAPASEETSANEEAPAAESAPIEAEAVSSEESPAAEEAPATNEAPAVENAPAPAAAAPKPEVEEAPLSRVELKAIPPRFSYDLGIQFGYGEITYWKEEVPAWATLGFAMAWGKHFESHRIGMGLAFVAEGPIPVHSSVFLEPTVRWDAIFGWLQLGASVGPAVGFHHAQRTVVHESKWDIGPVGSLRVGWSQPYTRLGRRLHVVLEPKVRMVDGRMNPTVAVYVGSGRGY